MWPFRQRADAGSNVPHLMTSDEMIYAQEALDTIGSLTRQALDLANDIADIRAVIGRIEANAQNAQSRVIVECTMGGLGERPIPRAVLGPRHAPQIAGLLHNVACDLRDDRDAVLKQLKQRQTEWDEWKKQHIPSGEGT